MKVTISVAASLRMFEPRGETDVRPAGCRASHAARTTRAPPIIFGRVDAARARCTVEGANVGHANIAAEQVVEMGTNRSGSVDGNVHLFVLNQVLRNDGALDRRTATAAIDVDSGGAGRGRVERVGAVPGDEVANDHIPIHVIRRGAKSGTHMRVQSDTRNTIVGQLVPNDQVTRGAPGAFAIGKKADSRSSDLHPVRVGDVVGDSIVENSIVGSVIGRSGTHRRMGGKDDAALERVVRDGVVDDDVVVACSRFVADQDAIGTAGHSVAGHHNVHRSYKVKRTAAVTAFIGLIGGLAVASRAGAENGSFLVIVHDPIVEDGGVRSADDQNPFI